jgi:5,8-dihydroxy-2-naphthoate synthase
MKKLSLGFSPCPNDTFIFDALVNKKIDSGDLEFEVVLEDVETLNRWALDGKLDITKLSFPAFFQSLNQYVLLNSGAALGNGVGPLLITKNENFNGASVENSTIALPGENTTANFLFSFAFPNAKNKIYLRYDKIEDFVLNNSSSTGTGDLGVIIHENRFTYQQKGLHKIVDLGEYWEEKMNLPIPLGGIAIKKNIESNTTTKIDRLIRQSIEFAFSNYPLITDYVKQHSQEMSEDVMKQHIDLYVNKFSIDLGHSGKQAIQRLYDVFLQTATQKDVDSSSQLFHS